MRARRPAPRRRQPPLAPGALEALWVRAASPRAVEADRASGGATSALVRRLLTSGTQLVGMAAALRARGNLPGSTTLWAAENPLVHDATRLQCKVGRLLAGFWAHGSPMQSCRA